MRVVVRKLNYNEDLKRRLTMVLGPNAKQDSDDAVDCNIAALGRTIKDLSFRAYDDQIQNRSADELAHELIDHVGQDCTCSKALWGQL